ncbi:MAG: type 4a pilus biogenesis protein PilO [Candidatus Aminicenantes bacterium]|nr:type 4a pilus biogenesis protein PilO [Candidatus Aminicenantes bacterium]
MRDWPWYSYIVVAALIFGLFYFFYYKPQNEELQSIREERITTEAEVAELRIKKEELDKIEAELETLNVKLRELETIIPQEEEIDVILSRIQQLAFDSRLSIEKFIPKALIDQEFFSEKPITIEITGNYHNLAIFFNRLSNFARLFIIENFTIKAARDQTDTNTITAATTAKTFIFKQEEPAAEETQQPARKRQ